MEQEELDNIGLSGAQSFLATQKKEIEEVLIGSIRRPEVVEVAVQIEKIRKEAEAKITIMINRTAASYYKDDNSITTIEDIQLKISAPIIAIIEKDS